MAGSIGRRQFLAASGGALAASALPGCSSTPSIVAQDSAAKSAHDLFDLGLVPVSKSGWTRPEGVKPAYAALTQDIETNVAIIGAGLAGASLALHLAEQGIATAVLEARQPGWGASGRNAGHVMPTMRDFDLVKAFPDGGRAFLDAFREFHTLPFDLSKRLKIDCDAVRSGYLNVMESRDAFDEFKVQSAPLIKLGIQKITEHHGADVERMTGSRRYQHALMFQNGGRVNPYLFSNGMIAHAVANGAKVHGDSAATGLVRDGQRWRVRTAQGSVLADRVVFCTNAYPTNVVPQFTDCFYPLTAYGLTTKPLPKDAIARIMPGGQTLSEAPMDINPLVKDRHNRLILSSLPSASAPEHAEWHFNNQLAWVHKTWPETQDMKIELESYWTGRVAMRDTEFPGTYQLAPGLFGLMHFNAWGNIMAPLMGKLFADGLAADAMDRLPFPLTRPSPVSNPDKQQRNLRRILLPAARTAQRIGII